MAERGKEKTPYNFINKVRGPQKATVCPTNALGTSVSMRLQINI